MQLGRSLEIVPSLLNMVSYNLSSSVQLNLLNQSSIISNHCLNFDFWQKLKCRRGRFRRNRNMHTHTHTYSALLLCVLKHVQNYYCVLCERDSIRHAFSADIINRLIIWQLGRAPRQRRSVLCQANEKAKRQKQQQQQQKEHTHCKGVWAGDESWLATARRPVALGSRS